MELITVLGLVVTLCYIVYRLYAQIQKDKKDTFEWTVTCVRQYWTAVRYQPSCREVLKYQRSLGR